MTERFLRPDELCALLAFYEDCKNSERTSWDEDYPNRDCAADDLQNATVCALFDGETLAAAVTVLRDMGELTDFDWPNTLKSPAELTRLGVRPQYQGHGLSKKLLSFALKTAKAQGRDGVRLMAYTGNPRAVALYKGAGFANLGRVFSYGNFYFLEELPLSFTCHGDSAAV